MLDPAWLVVVLFALAFVALGLAAYGWQQSRRPARPAAKPAAKPSTRSPARPQAQPSAPRVREEALDQLGLSEVRARAPSLELRPSVPEVVPVAPDAPNRAWPEPDDEPDTDPPLWTSSDPDFMDALDDDGGFADLNEFDELGVSSARPVGTSKPAPEAKPAAKPAAKPGTLPPAAAARTSAGLYLAAASPLWAGANPDAVGPLLVSLGAALGAQSVALLRYDARAGTYAVDVLAGRAAEARTAPFPSDGNALHRVPDDRSISLLEDDALDALQYHARPRTSVGHAAALTVEGPPERVLLVVDGALSAAPFTERHLALLGDYADLLGRLLGRTDPSDAGANEDEEAPEPPGAVADPFAPDEPEAAESEAAELEVDEPEADEEPVPVRPRADIIAEEIAAARTAERPLALALVALRDTEALEDAGGETVAEAEQALFERLRQVEGTARVERFGELLAGVFCYAGPALVEAWAEYVAASGPPVHVGAALLRARHLDAEALRADATAALRAAYERGEDCVILE